MDYEKMYKEALERAKKFEEKYGGGYAEYIFPELAESEDERILRVISEAVITFFSDYANDFEDEDRDAALAWLEKQKENPKSADSIPSDCVSDAKCEDRWHKVADSLPDNPREVLCKDEAGNFFIGRYYVGEGWEISNYDDEDKPHHLNPPVSKWIDFPSEEQKEQKPKAKAKSPLSPHELYDAKIEGIGQGRQDVLDHPEQFGLQKPAEWSEEDERMRNQLIYDVEYHKKEGLISARQNKATKALYNGIEKCYDEKIAWLKSLPERFNLQPKVEWSEEDEENLNSIISCLNRSLDGVIDTVEITNVVGEIAWLKSLRPQPHWKPSEEQIEALVAATVRYQSTGLESLYEDLKKL